MLPQDVERLGKNPALVVAVHGGDNMQMPLVMVEKPLADKRVRQALNYAVDKDSIAKVIYRGYAKPLTDAPLAPATFGYQPVGNYYGFDRAKARALLKDAGYEAGFKLKVIAPDGRYVNDRQAAEAVANYLKQVGVELELQTLEWGTYVGKLLGSRPDKADFGTAMITFATASMDADQGMVIYRGDNWPPNGFNFSFYKNQDVDRALARGRSAIEPRTVSPPTRRRSAWSWRTRRRSSWSPTSTSRPEQGEERVGDADRGGDGEGRLSRPGSG